MREWDEERTDRRHPETHLETNPSRRLEVRVGGRQSRIRDGDCWVTVLIQGRVADRMLFVYENWATERS